MTLALQLIVRQVATNLATAFIGGRKGGTMGLQSHLISEYSIEF